MKAAWVRWATFTLFTTAVCALELNLPFYLYLSGFLVLPIGGQPCTHNRAVVCICPLPELACAL